MGQEQSVPTPRRTRNKLSKPKTNSSPANLLSKSAVQLDRRDSQINNVLSADNRYNVASVEAVVGVEGLKGEKQQKQSKRRSLFRSRSSQGKEQLALDTGIEKESVDPSPVDRIVHRWSGQAWSRSNSITEETSPDPDHAPAEASIARPPNRARMSLQHVPYSQHHPRLSLVAELPTPESEYATRAKRLSLYGQEISSPQLSNPLNTRTNSETDLYIPMRRRSLLQHGVATRPSWAGTDSRQSLPLPVRSREDLQSYYYNPSKPTSSPLSNLASMRQTEVPGPRVETPNELDYSHIGAFKLGSLRITNGVASPSPSPERAATMGAEEDYIASRNVGRSVEGKHRRGISNRSNTFSVHGENVKAPWIVRSESPLRQAHEYQDGRGHLTIDSSLPILDPSLALFDFDTTPEPSRKTESPTKSQELANEYIQDIALSPYSFDPSRSPSPSPSPSPRLQATSKHTAIEDELFEAEPSTPPLSHLPSSFDSGYGALPIAASRAGNGPHEKPLAKADSGYSSNVSLRSFRTSGSANTAPAVPIKEPPPAPPKEPISRLASSTYSFNSVTSETNVRTDRSLPALPTDIVSVSARSFNDGPPVPLKHSNVYNLGKDIPAPATPAKTPEQVYSAAQTRPQVVMHTQHARQNSMPTAPNPVRPSFNLEDHRSGCDSSTSSNKHSKWRANKKEKQRPQSMQPQAPAPAPAPIFTVQAHHGPGEHVAIPPVSNEASCHLKDRVDSFPVVCFPNTFAGLRRTSSKETLGTIFSVGSGYTEPPMGREELTIGRLQSPLPAPPVPQKNLLSTMNSYLPPTATTRTKLLKKSISGEYSPASPRRIENNSLEVSKRGKSMTAQLEADAATQFASARNVSGGSWTSAATESTVLTTRKSFDSIARENPFDSRTSSWEYGAQVPQAPQRPKSTQPSQRQYLSAEEEQDQRRLSWLARDKKLKSQPPVSMQTQRKLTPTPHGSYHITPPSRPPPMAPHTTTSQDGGRSPALQPQPNRAVAPPPVYTSPHSPQDENWRHSEDRQDHWSEQKNFWADRRKTASEALQVNHRKSTGAMRSRKSMGVNRPPSTHQNNNLKMRRSLDAVHAKKFLDEKLDVSPNLRPYDSFVVSQQQLANNRAGDFANGYGIDRDERGWEEAKFDSNGEYNHTYGRTSPNKENRIPSPEKEYYEPDADFEYNDHHLLQNLHRSQNSTSDMLILDRFAGGLDYGYESGFGLGGSAGTRNVGKMAAGGRRSVDVSRNYSLDFSDAPIILQRVKIEV